VGDLTDERDSLITALKDKDEEPLPVIATHNQQIKNLNAEVLQKTLKIQELNEELQQALAAKESLGEERIWFPRRGLDMAYRKIRASNEFTGPLDDLTQAYTNIGYQEGLRDGYQYAADGVDVTDPIL
jgi:hypothetical protein